MHFIRQQRQLNYYFLSRINYLGQIRQQVLLRDGCSRSSLCKEKNVSNRYFAYQLVYIVVVNIRVRLRYFAQ
jgi:hypothetical protein